MAEVLITIGIIGVVAALTVPIIINSSQNRTNEAAFKKMYSNLTNVVNQVNLENGVRYDCFTVSVIDFHTNECTAFWKEVTKKLTPIKTCTGGVANNCQPKYTVGEDAVAAGGATYSLTCGGTKSNLVNNKNSYTFKDGSMMLSYSDSLTNSPLFLIDTNGFKKPNKWGYDVFILTLDYKTENSNTTVVSDRVCWIYEKGGKRINDILKGN